MSASIAKIVGTPSARSWAQIHTFVPDTPEQKKSHGELIAAIALSLEETTAVDVGREVIQRLQEEYYGEYNKSGYGQKITTPLENLQRSVETVASNYLEGGDLEIICAALYPEHIYFSVWGGGKVLVWRNGKLATILSARRGLSGTSSGVWQEEDVFILATSPFFEVIDNTKLAVQLRNNVEVEELADSLVSEVHQSPHPNLATVIFKAVKDIPEPEEQVGEVASELVTSEEPQAISAYDPGQTTIRLNQRPSLKAWLIKLAEKLPEKPVVVKTPSQSSRRTAISIGIVLLVLLGASILFGAQQKKSHDYKEAYKDKLVAAQNAYNDAILQKDINPPHSRELFEQAKNSVDSLVAQGVDDQELTVLKQKIDHESGTILGKVTTPAQSFFDLSLIRSGVSAREILPNQNILAILDSSGERIITVGMQDKQTNVLGGADKLANAKTFTLGDAYYVLSDLGIVKQTSKGASDVVVQSDSEWGEITKLGFYGSNLYALDRNHGIWRYSAGEKGFSAKQAWLKEESSVNFANVIDMAIDGSVWILASDGKIYKFNRGVQDNFSISGLDSFNSQAFYTDEDLDSLYILDSNNKRVVQVAKNGEYKKQYQTDVIGQAVDLVVSKNTNKIYLLTPDKIFTLDLQ